MKKGITVAIELHRTAFRNCGCHGLLLLKVESKFFAHNLTGINVKAMDLDLRTFTFTRL